MASLVSLRHYSLEQGVVLPSISLSNEMTPIPEESLVSSKKRRYSWDVKNNESIENLNNVTEIFPQSELLSLEKNAEEHMSAEEFLKVCFY